VEAVLEVEPSGAAPLLAGEIVRVQPTGIGGAEGAP
jgi:hypothetical protein